MNEVPIHLWAVGCLGRWSGYQVVNIVEQIVEKRAPDQTVALYMQGCQLILRKVENRSLLDTRKNVGLILISILILQSRDLKFDMDLDLTVQIKFQTKRYCCSIFVEAYIWRWLYCAKMKQQVMDFDLSAHQADNYQ